MAGTFALRVEPELGGRVASLVGPSGRDWLWRRPEAAAERAAVRPGDPFVDAGGWEECFPTIAGGSDHGVVWDRPWQTVGDGLRVAGDGFALTRWIEAGETVVARYRLEAEPGYRFVWAGHVSLEVSEAGRLVAAAGTRCRLWPSHWRPGDPVRQVEGPWPAPLGGRLDTLATDGSGLFFEFLAPDQVGVEDGESLSFRLHAPGQPSGVAVWRNLGAWPEEHPYRSLCLEPMIGWHYDRDRAAAGEVGVVPAGGVAEWALVIATSPTSGRIEAN